MTHGERCGKLESVAGAKEFVGISCALIGQCRSVASEHLGALPTSKSHQIAFLTAPIQPIMGEEMPELMRMNFADSGLNSAIFQDLIDAGVGDLASPP